MNEVITPEGMTSRLTWKSTYERTQEELFRLLRIPPALLSYPKPISPTKKLVECYKEILLS